MTLKKVTVFSHRNKTLSTVFLFLLLGAGAWMRFHALDRQSLWDDEMSTVLTVNTPRARILERFETIEVHPPLYFLQLKIWKKLIGGSLVDLRADSAFWGTVSLGLLFLLAGVYLGEFGRFAALALMTFSPLHLSYSQEARPYAFAIALGCAGLIALEQYLKRPGKKEWWSLVGLWSCLLYTHYWGSFAVAGQALYGLIRAKHQPHAKGVAYALFLVSAAFALWLPVLYAQMGLIGGFSFWVPVFSLLHPLKSLIAFTSLYFNVGSFVFFLPTRVGVLVLFGLAFAILFGWGVARGPLSAITWLSVGITIPWFLSLHTPGIYVWYRYPILMFPAFLLLMAAGAETLRPRWLGIGLLAVCLGAQFWGCRFYFNGWEKANPKSVVRYIHELGQRNTIVVRPAYFANLYNFYDHGETLAIDEHLLDSLEKRAALAGKTIVFVGFDAPDPVGAALLQEFHVVSGRYFPGYGHLGITVWKLQ